jgi:hypothetical protein
MPEINIVRIDEIAECVNRTLVGIRDGLLQARETGILARWPEKVDFQMVVVKDWQLLEMASGETSSTNETQGGSTAEYSSGDTTGNDSSTENGSNSSETAHNGTNGSDSRTSGNL